MTAFLETCEGGARFQSMTTYQVITLSAMGDADTPEGGSVCIRYKLSFVSLSEPRRFVANLENLRSIKYGMSYGHRKGSARLTLKSRMRRLLAAVDMMSRNESLSELANVKELTELEYEVVIKLVRLRQVNLFEMRDGNIKRLEARNAPRKSK